MEGSKHPKFCTCIDCPNSCVLKATKSENKEWREGRRCEICGETKDSNLISMCDNCLQNG